MTNYEHLNFNRKPGTARLSNRLKTIILTIDECIRNCRPYPALILIFSTIDVLGSLQNLGGFATDDSFMKWTKEYLFTTHVFLFNEADLYSSRCGIVHTLRYESENSSVNVLVYGFHGYDDEIKKVKSKNGKIGVYIEELFEAFKIASVRSLEDMENSTDPIINSNLNKLPKYVDLIQIN